MHILLREVRYAVRRLLRSSHFSLAVLATLSLVVGANILVFSVVDAVLFRELPFPQSDRLVMLDGAGFKRGADVQQTLEVEDWISENRTLESVALFSHGVVNLAGEPQPDSVRATQVSSRFFALLGIEPLVGNLKNEESDGGRVAVAVVSDSIWRRRFGSDPRLVGKTLRLNGLPHTVAAIMPAGMEFPSRTDVWVPAALQGGLFYGGIEFFFVGRLHPGYSLEEAQAELDIAAARESEQSQRGRQRQIVLVPLGMELAQEVRPSLILLQVGVAFVLLIAFVNLAGLIVARTAAQSDNATIRRALGASNSALVRQPLFEYIVLTVVGWLGGLLFARLSMSVFLNLVPRDLSDFHPIELNVVVAGKSLLVVFLLSLVLGVLPGLRTLRFTGPKTGTALREIVSRDAGHHRLSATLAVCQFALALVLLVGTGLMLTSFNRLLGIDLGFDPQDTVAVDVVLATQRHAETLEIDFLDTALERIRALPNVVAAGASHRVPLEGEMAISERAIPVVIEGLEQRDEEDPPRTMYRFVSPEYFRALGVPRLGGRDFAGTDTEESVPVAIVNRAAAETFWTDQNVVGKRLKPVWDRGGSWREVVGVVGNVRHAGPSSAPAAEVYLPYRQQPWRVMTIIVRTPDSGENAASAIRDQVQALDPELPLHNVRTMTAAYERQFSDRRTLIVALVFFAVSALLLAALGVYGLLTYLVSLRTREFGIHVAVGARPSDVLRRVLRRAAKWILLGVVFGSVASLALSRFLQKFLFDVTSVDASTFALAALVMVLVGLLAAYFPARRASRVDPASVLRRE